MVTANVSPLAARRWQLPFSNNQAEPDLLLMKLKQRISRGFRFAEGASTLVAIRSVLSTARKRGLNLLELLSKVIQGKTPTLLPGT